MKCKGIIQEKSIQRKTSFFCSPTIAKHIEVVKLYSIPPSDIPPGPLEEPLPPLRGLFDVLYNPCGTLYSRTQYSLSI